MLSEVRRNLPMMFWTSRPSHCTRSKFDSVDASVLGFDAKVAIGFIRVHCPGNGMVIVEC